MNRNDWVVVGMRLYGMYLLADVVINACEALRKTSGSNAGWAVVRLLLTLAVGFVFFWGAPLVVSWLQRKDEVLTRVAQAAQTPTP